MSVLAKQLPHKASEMLGNISQIYSLVKEQCQQGYKYEWEPQVYFVEMTIDAKNFACPDLCVSQISSSVIGPSHEAALVISRWDK